MDNMKNNTRDILPQKEGIKFEKKSILDTGTNTKTTTKTVERKEIELPEVPEIKFDKVDLQNIINNPEKFGLEEQREITSKVSALERKIIFYAKDESTKPITDRLYELQNKLEELNPATYEKAPFWKKILGLVPSGDKLIKHIAERYSTVKDYVEKIMMSLSDSKDQIIKDNIELERLEKELKEMNKELEEKIQLGKLALEELNKRHQQETDPLKKEKLENAIFILSSRLQDLQTMVQANMQFLLSIQKTLTNNKMLLSSLERTSSVTRTVLMVGLAIRGSLLNQKRAIETVKSTQEYTAQLLKDNADAIKHQTGEIESLYKEPVIAMKKLEEAYDTLLSAITDYEKIRREGIQIAQQNIQKLEQMNKVLKEKISVEEKQRGKMEG